MDKEVILQLSSEQLYNEFVEGVISNALGSEELVSELERSNRYIDDFVFRIHVQTARQFIIVCQQKYDEVLEKAEELIQRALTLEFPRVLTLNYHVLAISYKMMGFFEKALECFMNVLKYSRIYNLNNLTSIVYFYISEIYMGHNDMNTAIEYLNTAIEILEATKEQEPRYQMKKIMFSSNMIQLLYEIKQYEQMQRYVDIMQEYSRTDSSPQALYTYKMAMLFYLLTKKDFEEAKKVFYEILELIDDKDIKLQILKIYCAIMLEQDVDYSFYEKELMLAQNWGESRITFVNYALNDYLYKYFEKKGETDLAFSSLKTSFHHIEQEMLELKENKVNSFKLIEKNFSIEENISSVEKKNYELKLMADEANRNKILAESTLHRLTVVSELGKKLTFSLDVQDIIKTVYSRLVKSIPMNHFLIMIKNTELNQLESIAYYENGKVLDPLIIDYEDEQSVFVESFKKNIFIKIDDFDKSVRFEKQRKDAPVELFRSVLFLPLSIENEVLGVCSIQHAQPNVYRQEDVEFLEQLMPFLAIALNNAFKSQALEREINHHRKTQNELEQVNHKLEALSYLDGLTQISNRRDFEKRILDYLQKSREQKLSLSLFMFDIDNFKLFNDTYGHLRGDRALKSVATVIQRCFNEAGGISARFGGEEFVAACLGLNKAESILLGEKIREQVFSLGIINEKAPLKKLSISVGISYSNGSEELKKSFVMRWADVSLYQAKTGGKNRVVLKSLNSEDEPPEGLE